MTPNWGGVGGQGYHSGGAQQAGGKTVKNLMQSKKDRCKALDVGRTDPVNPYREGTDQLGSSSAENNLGDLTDALMTSRLNHSA